MDDKVEEFGIGNGDDELIQSRSQPGKRHRRKVRRRLRLRTPSLLDKLEGVARGGDVVGCDGQVPCVPVRVDELLAIIEWTRDLRTKVKNQRENQRQLIRRLNRV